MGRSGGATARPLPHAAIASGIQQSALAVCRTRTPARCISPAGVGAAEHLRPCLCSRRARRTGRVTRHYQPGLADRHGAPGTQSTGSFLHRPDCLQLALAQCGTVRSDAGGKSAPPRAHCRQPGGADLLPDPDGDAGAVHAHCGCQCTRRKRRRCGTMPRRSSRN